ncbi:MAG: VCBS repeat-containing protein, partial [Bacteroidota bacterium]
GNFTLIDDEYYPGSSSSAYSGAFGGESGIQDIQFQDFDSDGDLDLIVTSATNDLIIFENIDGDLGNRTTLATGANELRFFEFADIDNDGDMDLLHTDYYYGPTPYARLYAVENTINGAGTPVFNTVKNTVISVAGIRFGPITVLDADGDGDIDIVTHEEFGTELYGGFNQHIEGNTGDFTPMTFNSSTFGSMNFLEAADFDNDGDDDLILDTSCTGMYLSTLESGVFENISLNSGVVGNISFDSDEIAIGDVDADGANDFVSDGSSVININYDRAAPFIDDVNVELIIDEDFESGNLLGYLSLSDQAAAGDINVALDGDDALLFSFDETTNQLRSTSAFNWEEIGSDFDLTFVLSDETKTRRENINLKLLNLPEEGHGTF